MVTMMKTRLLGDAVVRQIGLRAGVMTLEASG
jgi:hypothetical protein